MSVVLLALAAIPGAARAASFSADEQATLARGEVVRRPLDEASNNEGYVGGTSFAIVNAPPDVVWRAMRDFASFPSIFPAGALQNGLLGAPGDLRDWVQGPNGARYLADGTATATAQ